LLSYISHQDLENQPFDWAYVERLRSGDTSTTQHFVADFNQLIEIKLGLRLKSRQAIEYIRRETFARVFVTLRDSEVQPDRLGSLVNSTCNTVLLEYLRFSTQDSKNESTVNFNSTRIDSQVALSTQSEDRVRQILQNFSDCDRRLLHAVFVEKREKGEACRSFGVSREHLRALLHRAVQSLREQNVGNPGSAPSIVLTA
jgi:RNA polymerase sigma-70 factor (ECF subfamily)